MLGSTLDAAIGLTLVFLLFSILLTTLTEIIASRFKLRARALEDAIARLIENPQAAGNFLTPLVGLFGTNTKASVGATDVRSVAGGAPPPAVGATAPPIITYADVYDHPLVGGSSGKGMPSYVPSAGFATALIQALSVLGGGSAIADIDKGISTLPDGSLKTTLSAVIDQAAGNIATFRLGVEAWYDGAMDRLSGDYKRFTQVITFVLGLGLAVAFNVDAVNVAQRLFTEPALRKSLETAAETYVKTPPAGAPVTSQNQTATIQSLGDAQTVLVATAPIGWSGPVPIGPALALAMLGWVLTALAGLLGAPFWFDTLQGLVNIRNAGPKPPSTTSGASS